MSATQNGTGSLTLGAPLTLAPTFVTVPSGAIIESINVTLAGTPQQEDQYDSDGAFHTSLWFEKRMDSAVIVMVGKAYAGTIGSMDGTGSKYEVMSIVPEYGKGVLRTTITVRKLVFT